MTEDTSGDIENPSPDPQAKAGDPSSDDAGGEASGKDGPTKKRKVIALSAFLLAVVVLAIVLGVSLGRSGSSDASSKDVNANTENAGESSNVDEGTTAATTLPSSSSATNPALARPNNETVSAITSTASTKPFVAVVDPSVSVDVPTEPPKEVSQPTSPLDTADQEVDAAAEPPDEGKDSTTTLPTTIAAGAEASNEGTATAQPVDNNATATALPTNAPPKEDVAAAPIAYEAKYLKSKGPIPARVRRIDRGVADGYDSCGDLRDDMLEALKHYASSLIERELNNNWYENCDPNNPDEPYHWYEKDEAFAVGAVAFAPEMAADSALESAAPPPGAASGASLAADAEPKEDSFDTNNQVEGVDEGDVVKSDGDYVYAAYGDLLYVWNATDGTQGVSVTPMPYEKVNETECTYKPYYPPWYPKPMFVDEAVSVSVKEEVEEPETPMLAEETVAISVEKEVEELEMVSISSEQVHSKGGEEEEPDPDESVRRRNRLGRRGRKALSIAYPGHWNPCEQPKPRILSLLLEGSRLSVIVSEDLYYLSYYPSLKEEGSEPSTIDEHTRLAIRVYDVSNVTFGSPLELLGEREIKGNYESARSIDDTGLVITTSYVNKHLFGQDLYRSNSRYCGMNSSAYEALAVEVALNNTEPFLDRMLGDMQLHLDGTCNGIFRVAAMQSGDSDEDGTKTDGDMLRQFVQVLSFNMSSDFVDKNISTNVAGCFSSGWLSSVYASQGFVAALNEGSYYDPATSSWDSATFILGFDIGGVTPKPFCYAEVPGRPGVPRNPYVTDLYDGHLRVVTTQRSWSNVEGSRTTNKIWILKVPSSEVGGGQEMTLTAETEHLGKPNENVQAVRYIGPRAYIVTFERTDPFYIYDLSNHTDPKKLGELEVPGFSSYLHPVSIEGVDFILGVGIHVDEVTQQRVGLKISLYDISNATNPTENATFIDKGAYSSGGTDFKAFRFLTQSKKLILPKKEYGEFDGFVVYDVGLGSVAPGYEIEHASAYAMRYGCWYNARMPARSFVFQSKVTTILSHSVISTDLGNGDRLWNFTLGDGLSSNACVPYFP